LNGHALSFESWSTQLANRFGYSVSFEAIGELDAKLGAPTQMAIFYKTITKRKQIENRYSRIVLGFVSWGIGFRQIQLRAQTFLEH